MSIRAGKTRKVDYAKLKQWFCALRSVRMIPGGGENFVSKDLGVIAFSNEDTGKKIDFGIRG